MTLRSEATVENEHLNKIQVIETSDTKIANRASPAPKQPLFLF